MLSRMTTRTLRKQTSSTTTSSSSSSTRIKTPDYRTLSTTQKPTSAAPAVVSQVFQPWPAETKGVVTCHGDYRQEAWLERHIGGPLYAHQDALPHLPVPTVTDTVQRFLPTATSLATTPHERHELQRKAQVFSHQAAVLQQRLLQRADEASSNTKSSWLQHWWNHLAYLEYRDSVVINVSYFFHLADDAAAALHSSSSSSTSSTNNLQIRRAAALMTAANQVRRQVCSGTWPAESVGRGDSKKMLCSVAFKYMFHACRIPTTTRDTVKIYDPALHYHVVVACRGHFFQVPLCDPVTGIAYPLSVLEASLQNVLDQSLALEQNSTSAHVPKLGTLTAWNRDDWTLARTALLQAGGDAMQQALQIMESAAFVICLDVDVAPVSRAACASWFLHTSAESCSINRWWDKSIQLSICQNGKAGLIGEHSMMDGMPNVGLAHHLTVQTYDKCLLEQQQPANNKTATSHTSSSSGAGTATPIFGPDLYPALMQVQSMVQRSRDDFTKLVNQQSLSVQSFQGYGSDFIKKAVRRLATNPSCSTRLLCAGMVYWLRPTNLSRLTFLLLLSCVTIFFASFK
jgi:carnitine O-acetyltransferase